MQPVEYSIGCFCVVSEMPNPMLPKPFSVVDCIQQQVYAACYWEATAPKLGNVHPGARFDDLTYQHFLKAAEITSQVLSVVDRTGYGPSVLEAVRQCQQQLQTNANLGIILLLAPLTLVSEKQSLQLGISDVIDSLGIDQAEFLFEAIRLANPGGLGEADEQDVRQSPTLSVREAMALAADRDQIAKAYRDDYEELFGFGVPTLLNEVNTKGQSFPQAIISLQLRWLAHQPDSLIVRKSGWEAGIQVQQKAIDVLQQGGMHTEAGRKRAIQFDEWLRLPENRYNPGTTADLIAATLYIAFREQWIPIPENTGSTECSKPDC